MVIVTLLLVQRWTNKLVFIVDMELLTVMDSIVKEREYNYR